MIISRTPYRVSFFGGGTDYPGWYRENGGAVLATSISRYCYLTCRYLPPFFEHRTRIVYSQIEMVQGVEEIKHPAVRECMRFLDVRDGVEIHHDGDLPKQSGLGTSSSFCVGLLHALHAMRGDLVTPQQLAAEAIAVEQERCGENVGSQDQVTAAFGGLNVIHFGPGQDFRVTPLTLSKARLVELQSHLMLFFTGFSRTASDVAAEQVRNIPRKTTELTAMRQMVDEAVGILTGSGSLDTFGKLMHEGWKLKKSMSTRVSLPEIDSMYESAVAAGASGGKVTGAGGGGFLLMVVDPSRQAAVRAALARCLCVPFELDRTGSQIIFFQPNEREVRSTPEGVKR